MRRDPKTVRFLTAAIVSIWLAVPIGSSGDEGQGRPLAGAGAAPAAIYRAGAPGGAPGTMSGSLRHALRSWDRLQRVASATGALRGLDRDGAGDDSFIRQLMIDSSGETARTTFHALLARGSREEVEGLRAAGARIRGQMGRVVSFEASLVEAATFAAQPAVLKLDIAHRMRPELEISGPETRSDLVRDSVSGFGGTGAGVLVATLDTGQDVKHGDFRHADGTTRFKALWNMDPACKGDPPPGHSTGCYYTSDRINRYLTGKSGLKYGDPAIMGGHGTHVMGTAAGNGLETRKGYPAGVYVGMAPEADLIGVRVFNEYGAFVGDLIEGLQFLGEEQERQGSPPIVVNISLGHQYGAHDGSDSDEAAIDAFVQEGLGGGITRVVVKSAGNDGGSGMYVTSIFGPVVHPVTVPVLDSDGGACGSFLGAGNDLFVSMLWYPGNSTVRISVTTGDNAFTFGNDTGNPYGYNYVDTTYGSIFADCPASPDPINGDRYCWVGVDDSGGYAPSSGTWKIMVNQLSGPQGGKYDAWMVIGQKGYCNVSWDAPSPGGTISIPGTAQEGITVGAYMTRTSWTTFKGREVSYEPPPTTGDIAFFSSEGPTRDGRIKPDLAAPGMGIAAARSSKVSTATGSEGRLRTLGDKKHMVLEGTSMAAPHVAGAAAQLLSVDPTLDAHQVRMLLLAGALSDGFTGAALPDNVWGHGKLDVFEAAETQFGPP